MGAPLDRISNCGFAVNIVNGCWKREIEVCGNGVWLDRNDDRYIRMDEYMQVMKGLWTKDDFSFEGLYYNVDHSPVRFETIRKPWPPF